MEQGKDMNRLTVGEYLRQLCDNCEGHHPKDCFKCEVGLILMLIGTPLPLPYPTKQEVK